MNRILLYSLSFSLECSASEGYRVEAHQIDCVLTGSLRSIIHYVTSNFPRWVQGLGETEEMRIGSSEHVLNRISRASLK